ncbi:GATA-binding factor 6-B, partial [Lentinula raphanica]
PNVLIDFFQGNKSFVAFSNLSDVDALTRTWKVCTKVASYLEQGQRLENLSWRLWHLQNLMVDTDNAKSKREFKKLSKNMGDRLDREKGRNISELSAPDFKPSHSTDLIRQRAVERERNREEAAQDSTLGGTRTMKRMQFTFSVNDGGNSGGQPMHVDKPDLKPSAELSVRAGPRTAHSKAHDHMDVLPPSSDTQPSLTQRGRKNDSSTSSSHPDPATIRFPALFSSDFGPAALLYPSPTLTTQMNYGEDFTTRPYENESNDSQANQSYSAFSIPRPTIELPLDELLRGVDGFTSSDSMDGLEEESSWRPCSESIDLMSSTTTSLTTTSSAPPPTSSIKKMKLGNIKLSLNPTKKISSSSLRRSTTPRPSNTGRIGSAFSSNKPSSRPYSRPSSSSSSKQSVRGSARTTPRAAARVNTVPRPTLTVRTSSSGASARSSLPSATAPPTSSITPSTSSTPGAPAGQKAECHNCGATHTPLWRRGLNDELNCNACGLYCKLHKRPRPKTMRNQHGGEGGRGSSAGREAIEIMAQCYNCHTTATPLWRKDDEGKTVCNACGLYYKLHGSARPISMKSDVIRKRSRHDAHAAMQARRAKPSPVNSVHSVTSMTSSSHSLSTHSIHSPTFAPDSSTATDIPELSTMGYDNGNHSSDSHNTNNDTEHRDDPNGSLYTHNFSFPFPGPYHPDHINALYYDTGLNDNGFGTSHNSTNPTTSPPSSPLRINKRRRMSSDSASEPPSSAISSLSSSYSNNSEIDHSTANYGKFGAYSNDIVSGNGVSTSNAFWHPPMLLQEHQYHALSSQHNQDSQNQNQHQQYTPSAGHSSHPGHSSHSGHSSNSGHNGHRSHVNEDSPMDYLHPPMTLNDDDEAALFSTYLHPPMSLPDDSSATSSTNGNGVGSMTGSRTPNTKDVIGSNAKGRQENVGQSTNDTSTTEGKGVSGDMSKKKNQYYGLDLRIY